ncbi:MAG TPA: hypothetical protein PLF16_00045 [Candidatus Staskawiczbacteria bacterium]|nr:hypothetical protein [Candidatus Staskawiczbacteria bacterium]
MIALTINLIWLTLGGIAGILFLLALLVFLASGDSPEKLNTAKLFFIWAIVLIILAVSFYSVVKVIEFII